MMLQSSEDCTVDMPSRTATSRRQLYVNPAARLWTSDYPSTSPNIRRLHESLPGYELSRLTSLDAIARELNVKKVLVKDETSRCGLPAFKILGASWAAFRAVAQQAGLPLDSDLKTLSTWVRSSSVVLVAATEGNHGRAVARVAKILGTQAMIFVPKHCDPRTIVLIESEGAKVVVVDGDYDVAVQDANRGTHDCGGILIQDNAFGTYHEIPQWVVDGYSTMMSEIDDQLKGEFPDLIVVPVGVGSLAQAVVSYSKRAGRSTRVLAVEPDGAACLQYDLRNGTPGTLAAHGGHGTIMCGMNCATVSPIAWPVLEKGVDVSVTVSDFEAYQAVLQLSSCGINAGPCGGATLAALRIADGLEREALGLNKDSVVVILCTEGQREYEIPLDVSVQDPVALTQSLVRIDSANPALSNGMGAGELDIAKYITAWLHHRDIECHWLEKTPGRPSVVGVVRGAGGGKSLLLTGHIDTTSLASYDKDPLSGEIRDGAVYGRGSFDMKAGIAACLAALCKAKTLNLSGDVIFAGVADEEYMSAGTEELLEAGWVTDAGVVCEPTCLNVTLSHKGFVWFEVDIVGTAAHGSRYDLGVDAISKAGYFLVELDKLSTKLLQQETNSPLGTGSVHASVIQGGEEPSSYPALCTIKIERRTVPGESFAMVEEELHEILEKLAKTVPGFKYKLRVGLCRSPFNIEPDNEFVSLAIRNIADATGKAPIIEPQAYWTDCALLADKGISSFLFGVNGEGAHAATEWATVESITKLKHALDNIVGEYCK